MLPFAPDWRWLLDRADSPWYPSARLFRQPAPLQWEPVVAEIAGELGWRAIGAGVVEDATVFLAVLSLSC